MNTDKTVELIHTGPRADFQREVHGKVYFFCGTCGQPLRPCPKGPGADEPGYVGFFHCCGDRDEPIYADQI
jgi:hypothetical protein